jgi:hypothetical protein
MGWRALALSALLALVAAGGARADVVEVTGWQVNVREQPSRSAPVIVTLHRGARFEVLGRSGRWYRVRMVQSGGVGYVHESLVRVVPGATLGVPEPEATRPVARPAPTPRPPAPTAPAPAPRPAYTPPAPATLPPPASPPAELETRRLDVAFQVGVRWLTAASRSAEAILDGETSGLELGGFASYAITRNVFLRGAVQVFRKEGQRVFVVEPDGPVFPLGHPLKLRLIPAYVVVGYRFHPWPSVVPYVAVGGGATFSREESTVGVETDSSSSTKGMGIALAGVDYVKSRLVVGVEASWSTVPNALGAGGVSAVYDEKGLGGVAVSAHLGVAF